MGVNAHQRKQGAKAEEARWQPHNTVVCPRETAARVPSIQTDAVTEKYTNHVKARKIAHTLEDPEQPQQQRNAPRGQAGDAHDGSPGRGGASFGHWLLGLRHEQNLQSDELQARSYATNKASVAFPGDMKGSLQPR